MGQRANLVVIQDGVWRLYYDHWCANRLDVELFWGPELARQFIEQRAPKEQGPTPRSAGFRGPVHPRNREWLLDEVWCEGAAVLDLDERVLLFFGGEDLMRDAPLRRAYLHLMRENWAPWQIRWAHEGVAAIGDYIGVARDDLIKAHDFDPDESFRVLTEFPEDNLTLMTTMKDGVASARRIYGDAEALEQGPEGLIVLDEIEGVSSLVWENEMPTGGVHVDFDSATVSFWWAEDTPAIEERIGAAWPGWNIDWLRDEFERQLALCGLDVRLPERSLVELQTEVLGRMRRLCVHDGDANPARELHARFGAAAEINSATDESRSSVGDDVEKLELLDALASRLPLVPKISGLHSAGTA
jgi:hypothetical protein